jgi:E3 ubiquitin-protein ligase HERC3
MAELLETGASELTGPIANLVTGEWHSCVTLPSIAQVKCWGNNAFGQLGIGDINHRGDNPGEMGANLPPVQLDMDLPTGLFAGSNHTCARATDGRIKCWGANQRGQLGLGDTNNRGDNPGEKGASLPYANLGTGRTVKSLALGSSHTCAILDNDKIKCWGEMTSGN